MTHVDLATVPPVRPLRRDHPASGYVFAMMGALLLGINGSVAKVVMAEGISAAQVTLMRTLATAIIAGAYLALRDPRQFRVTRRQWAALAVLGIAGMAMVQWTYSVAIALLPVGIALLLEYTAVLMVALVAWLILHEQVRRRLWLAIALVLSGLAVVAQVWDSDLDGLGVVAGLGAAVSFSVYFLVGERSVATMTPMAVTFWSMLFAAAFWSVFSSWWLLDPRVVTANVSLTGALADVVLPLWAPILWVVTLGSFVPFLLLFLALQRLNATTVSILGSSEVVFAFLVAWVWLGEALTLAQSAGAAVVIAGIILAQTARTRRPSATA